MTQPKKGFRQFHRPEGMPQELWHCWVRKPGRLLVRFCGYGVYLRDLKRHPPSAAERKRFVTWLRLGRLSLTFFKAPRIIRS